SGIPFGFGFTKPHNYWEVVRTAWQNKRNPLFTWRILRDGVCDGCALGTTGMRDSTMKGIHLCTVRLNLLPLNTMGPLDTRILKTVNPSQRAPRKDYRPRGRPPSRMLARGGTGGSPRSRWQEPPGIPARRIWRTPPIRQPGLERYWLPSVPDSALFGPHFADAFFPIHTGGDIAFINGVLKHMSEKGWIHDTFVAAHTTGFGALRASLEKQSWEELEV